MYIGAIVEVLPPFDDSFPGEYVVLEVNTENTCVMLEGVDSAFDFKYVKVKGKE